MTYPFVRAQRVEGREELLARLKVLALGVHAAVIVGEAAQSDTR